MMPLAEKQNKLSHTKFNTRRHAMIREALAMFL
jgi:hypothetical protein